MRFHIIADGVFSAENIDDAFRVLANHFLGLAAEGLDAEDNLDFVGVIEIQPEAKVETTGNPGSGATKEQIVGFLKFLESNGMSIGGDAVHGFALEYTTYRPLHPDDCDRVIEDFLKEK